MAALRPWSSVNIMSGRPFIVTTLFLDNNFGRKTFETRQSVGGTKTGEPPRKTKPPDTLASRTWFVSHGQNGVRTHTRYSGENFGHKSHKMEAKSRHDHSCGLERYKHQFKQTALQMKDCSIVATRTHTHTSNKILLEI